MTSVMRYRDRPGSVLTLEPKLQKSIAELGMTACKFVTEQNPDLWLKASGNDLLRQVAEGAVCLAKIGKAKGPSMAVNDCISHLSFVTCIFLSSQADRLSPQLRKNLRFTILLLAECCPVDLMIPYVPPLSELPWPLRMQSIMRKHYPLIEQANGQYLVTLADALRLLSTMERAPVVKLIPLITEFRKLTEGLRTSLKQTDLEMPN